jgi:hypothetical protein
MAESDQAALNFRGVLQIIGLSTSVIAALGYVSLRSYLNFLGVAATVDLSIDQLLYEAYQVGSLMLLAVLFVLSVAAAASLVLWGAIRLVPKKARDRLAGSVVWLSKVNPALYVFGGVFAGAAVLIVLFFEVVDLTSVLLLPASKLVNVPQHPILFVTPVALLTATVAAYVLLRSKLAEALSPALRLTTSFAFGLFTLGLIWIAIIACNMHLRGTTFPLVVFADKTGSADSATCALLVYSTNNQLVLWDLRPDAMEPRGLISIRVRAGVTLLHVLDNLDVRTVARQKSPLAANAACQSALLRSNAASTRP